MSPHCTTVPLESRDIAALFRPSRVQGLPKRFVTSDRGRNNVQINTRGLHRNVCRSPIGERLLRQHLPDRYIASAGIFGLEKGARRMTAPRT